MKVHHLAPKIEELLVLQIQKEHQSSINYLAMAVWAEVNLYPGTAAFFYQQSEEEREHMLKIVRYLTNLSYAPVLPATQVPTQNYQDLPSMLRQFLAQEQSVTQAVHQLVDQALEKKDYATFQFLQWFVAEQQEEEAIARKALDLCQVLSPDGFRRHAIDQEMAKLLHTAGDA
ncbi:MAG: ferritin [Cytophagales bacterium]